MGINRVLVIGEQSLGFVLGGLLSGAGMDVTFVIDDEYQYYSLTKNGLYLFGRGIEKTLEIHTESDFSDLSGVYDFLIFCSSRLDRVHDISFLLDHVHPDTAVLCCQNGIVEDIVEDILAGHTIISFESGIVSASHAPGNVEIKKIDTSYIGIWRGSRRIFQEYFRLFNSFIPLTERGGIVSALYSNLVFNACLGPICAISGIPYGTMLRNQRFRSLIIGVMSEAIQVADAMGIKVEPYKRVFDYYSYLRGDNHMARFNRNLVLFLVSFGYEERISPQLRAILDGKKADIDSLNGFITRCARSSGIITPLNDLLINMVKEIENKNRQIGVENFEQEFFYFYG